MSEDKEELVLPGENVKPKALGIRHLVVFMGEVETAESLPGFLGFANVYAMRVNLSVAIVAMVNSTVVHHNTTNTSSEYVSELLHCIDCCPQVWCWLRGYR